MTRAHHSAHGRPTSSGLPRREISAILVWSSPRDWCLDLQVLADLMLSSGGIFGNKSLQASDITLPNDGYLQDSQPKLYFCNPDFEWATPHHRPRFAQGAFREAFRGIWTYATRNRTDAPFDPTIMGKPREITYIYGEKMLQAYNEKLAHQRGRPVPSIKTVYMIGDNPESDIAGANQYTSRMPEAKWRSILVQTGVYRAGPPVVQPHHIARDVTEAVKLALEQEKDKVAGLDRLVADLQSPAGEEEHKIPRGSPLDPNVLPETFGALKLDVQPK